MRTIGRRGAAVTAAVDESSAPVVTPGTAGPQPESSTDAQAASETHLNNAARIVLTFIPLFLPSSFR